MDYELVVFKHEEREAFRKAFATLSHTSDDAAQKRREWWCFDNPYGGAFAVIRAEGEIAATCYLGGKKLLIGGQEFTCFEIGETATDPAHQRKGLFMKIAGGCVGYSQQQQSDIVYGTPNRQATPGWAKFGFKIISDDASWLFIIPNSSFWLRFNIPSLNRLFGRDNKVSEINGEHYIDKTKDFSRLNASNLTYLRWRMAESPSAYRYFSLMHQGNEFLCAIKTGVLGKYPLLIVGEHFLDGQKVPIEIATWFLRKVVSAYYDRKQFMGLYVHGEFPTKASLWLKLAGIIPHRHLPICAYGSVIDNSNIDWFKDFQLSDCDIG